MMTTYSYRYVDAQEITTGSVDASGMVSAAIQVFQGGDGVARWRRHGIREKDVAAAPNDAEFCEFDRRGDGSYSLELKRQGSRKRKPVHCYA